VPGTAPISAIPVRFTLLRNGAALSLNRQWPCQAGQPR
jgi:hypothetical protein